MASRARICIAVVVAALVDLALHGAIYAVLLADFFDAHPAGSDSFVEQLQRQPDELVVWALALSALAMGAFVTAVMWWSGTDTWWRGLRRGAVVGGLFWTAINSGLYASSHLFSLPGVLLDTPCSAACMAVAAACAASLLHPRGGTMDHARAGRPNSERSASNSPRNRDRIATLPSSGSQDASMPSRLICSISSSEYP